MGKYKVVKDWFLKTDENGYKFSVWLKQKSETEVLCMVCNSTINCDSKGYQAVKQHASCQKHKSNCIGKLSQLQLKIRSNSSCSQESSSPSVSTDTEPSSSVSDSRQGVSQLYSERDVAIRSEIIWCLNMVSKNYSASSCDDIKPVLRAMFPDNIPVNFSLGRTKISYMLMDGLAPYFRQKLETDLSSDYFTVCFDETTNVESHKEQQIAVRYWSPSQNAIVVHHLHSYFIGHADAETVVSKIMETIEMYHLALVKLLMVSSDGPNVNKKVLRILSEKVKSVRHKGLLNVGTCTIHTVHNAFHKGLLMYGDDVCELLMLVYNFFDGWPARCEDYRKIQAEKHVPSHVFIKYVPSRWFTTRPALERLLEQYKAIQEYFIRYIPKKNPTLLKASGYLMIVRKLKDPSTKCEASFVCESAELFEKFVGLFQKVGPLIHILYQQLNELILTLVSRICKTGTSDMPFEEMFKTENMLPHDQLVFAQRTSEFLSTLSASQKLVFVAGVQKHYVAAGKYIVQKTALSSNSLLKYCSAIHPEQYKKPSSEFDLMEIAKQVPVVINTSVLIDEWRLLKLDNHHYEQERIDFFWRKIFEVKNASGNPKYCEVIKIVKCILTLSHGNADVERGFSLSGRTLTEERASMGERMLNARLITYDSLKACFNNDPTSVPITRELIHSAYTARQRYMTHLENAKKEQAEKKAQQEAEEEEREAERRLAGERKKTKSEIDNLHQKLLVVKETHESKREAADQLLLEANKRLKLGLQKKDLGAVQLAQAMIEGVTKVREEERQQQDTAEKLQSTISKQQSSLITQFFKKSKLSTLEVPCAIYCRHQPFQFW